MDNTTKFLIELGSSASLRNAFKENPQQVMSNYDLENSDFSLSFSNDDHKLMIFTPDSNHKLLILTHNSHNEALITS